MVKETPDATKSGAAEVVRKDEMKLFEARRSIEVGKDGQSSKWAEMVIRGPLGGPTCSQKLSIRRAKTSFKKVGLGCFKKEGRWAGSFRPNKTKGLK